MTEKLDLEAIRREIDEADSNLINAFERRLQAVLRVAEYKKHRASSATKITLRQ